MSSPETMLRGFGSEFGFSRENDARNHDDSRLRFTDGTELGKGYRSVLEQCERRNVQTNQFLEHNHTDRFTKANTSAL